MKILIWGEMNNPRTVQQMVTFRDLQLKKKKRLAGHLITLVKLFSLLAPHPASCALSFKPAC